MDVKCEKCATEYEFDDAKVTETGITVKCTHCGHLFRVARSAAAAVDAAPPLDLPSPAHQWMIRGASGEINTFRDLATLQQWIVEGRVSRSDEISKNGGSWKPLGSIIELSSFFVAVQTPGAPASPVMAASRPTRQPMEPPASRFEAPESAPATVQDRVPPMLRPPMDRRSSAPRHAFDSMAPMHPTQPPMQTLPAHHSGVYRMPAAFPTMPPSGVDGLRHEHSGFVAHGTPIGFEMTSPPVYSAQQTGGAARGFLVGVLASAALAGGAYFVIDQLGGQDRQPSVVARADAGRVPVDRKGAVGSALRVALERAQIAYTRDTAEGFAEAETGFQSILVKLGQPPTIPSLAAEARLGLARVASAQAEYEKLSGRDGAALLGKAKVALEAARALAPNDPEVHLDYADFHRIRGDDAQVERYLTGAAGAAESRTEFTRAARGVHSSKDFQAIAKRLEKLSPGALTIPRARYLKAWVLEKAGRSTEALAAVHELLAVTPKHRPGQEMLERLSNVKAGSKGSAAGAFKQATPAPSKQLSAKAAEPKAVKPKAAEPKVGKAKRRKATSRSTSGQSYDALMASGHRLLEQGKTSQARKKFLAAVQKQPAQPEPFSNLGWCDLDQGRPRAAIKQFQKALRRSARYSDAMYGLGVAREQSGDRPRAIEAYRKYVETHPSGGKANMVRRKLERLQ